MDSGNGNFEQFDNDQVLNQRVHELIKLKEKVGSIFHVGEVIELKKSKFKIKSIGKREMRLRLMPINFK